MLGLLAYPSTSTRLAISDSAIPARRYPTGCRLGIGFLTRLEPATHVVVAGERHR
jgi:hypothetical protein